MYSPPKGLPDKELNAAPSKHSQALGVFRKTLGIFSWEKNALVGAYFCEKRDQFALLC